MNRLGEAEKIISKRFPGILDGPPPPEKEEIIDVYFWYDSENDSTSLVLPIPSSCWLSPPNDLADPRGQVMCKVIWSFVQTVAEPTPIIEFENSIISLEYQGDQSSRFSEMIWEVRISTNRKVNFMASHLPQEILESFL